MKNILIQKNFWQIKKYKYFFVFFNQNPEKHRNGKGTSYIPWYGSPRPLPQRRGKYGITVNVLAPGWFKTSQNAVLYENKEWVNYITDRIPLNRPGQPNDLDGTVIFSASDASEYITGQMILVDGGFTTGATKAII